MITPIKREGFPDFPGQGDGCNMYYVRQPLFSDRMRMAREAEEWVKENGMKNDAFGVICALNAKGWLVDVPTDFTDAREEESA